MAHATEWKIKLHLFEHEDHTTARAVLETGANTLAGEGIARRNPHDRPVPEIGDELAAARALTDLAERLMSAARTDIAAVVND